MFHHFHGGTHLPDGQGSLSSAEFETILVRSGISRIACPGEWIERAASDSLLPGMLCVTFDDGLKSQLDVALPILQKHGLRAFWFIYSAPLLGRLGYLDLFRRFRTTCFPKPVDYYEEFFGRLGPVRMNLLNGARFRKFLKQRRQEFPFYSLEDHAYRFFRDFVLSPVAYRKVVLAMMKMKNITPAELGRGLWLSEGDLRDLHNLGHEIGLHSFDHPTNLARLPANAQRDQYRRNYEHLRKICGIPRAMSHPCNSYNHETLRLLAKLGIRCGFRSNLQRPPSVAGGTCALELPREDAANLRKGSIQSR